MLSVASLVGGWLHVAKVPYHRKGCNFLVLCVFFLPTDTAKQISLPFRLYSSLFAHETVILYLLTKLIKITTPQRLTDSIVD